MMVKLRIEMVNPQRVILDEIAMPEMKRNDVALTYALCLRQHTAVDFRKINRAIINRWSFSALDYIKARAWGIFAGKAAI